MWAPLATAIVLALMVLASGCGSEADRASDCQQVRFDSRAWKEARADAVRGTEVTVRDRLARKLIECDELDRRSRAEVRRMLGTPDERQGDDWSYTLGPSSGPGSIDSAYLDVYFRDGRVSKAERSSG